MLRETTEEEAPLTGNDLYEGLCVDILDEIAAEVGFDYTLEPVKDNQHGSKDVNTGDWSGLIGSIKNRVKLSIELITKIPSSLLKVEV